MIYTTNHNEAGLCWVCLYLPMLYFSTKGDLRIGPNCLGSPARTTWPDSAQSSPVLHKKKINQHIKHVQYNYRKHVAVCFLHLPVGLSIRSPQHVLPHPQTHEWNARWECFLWPACRDQRERVSKLSSDNCQYFWLAITMTSMSKWNASFFYSAMQVRVIHYLPAVNRVVTRILYSISSSLAGYS